MNNIEIFSRTLIVGWWASKRFPDPQILDLFPLVPRFWASGNIV